MIIKDSLQGLYTCAHRLYTCDHVIYNVCLIIIHQDEHQHALKEIDAVALAVTKNVDEVIKILQYTIKSSTPSIS